MRINFTGSHFILTDLLKAKETKQNAAIQAYVAQRNFCSSVQTESTEVHGGKNKLGGCAVSGWVTGFSPSDISGLKRA